MFPEYFIDILFLPLAVLFFVCTAAFFLFGKRYFSDRKTGVLLLFFVLLMALWRIPIASASTRYWAVILYPVILFSGYCLYSSGIGKRIPRLLLVILTGICLLKDFRLNWNNNAITNAAAAIAEDAQNYPRVLASELRQTSLLERIGYYSHVPILSSIYCDGIQIEGLYEPARGLYDVLYVVAEDTVRENQAAYEKMKPYGAQLLFSQDKDMRKKKKVYVYKFEIPRQDNTNLPIQRAFADENWWKNAIKYLSVGEPGNENSFYFRNDTLQYVFSPNIDAGKQDAILRFDVRAKRNSHIRLYCIGYDKDNREIFHKTLMLTRFPEDINHQFQIPVSAKDLEPALKVNYRWYVIAPNGMYMDNVGFFDKK